MLSIGIVLTLVFLLLIFSAASMARKGALRGLHNVPSELHKKVRKAKKEFHRIHYRNIRASSTGNVLYRAPGKTRLGISALIVYTDGIYGMFAVGHSARYRFNHFREISKVFEVRVFDPSVKDTKGRSKEQRWLQIETLDYEVLLLRDCAHDIDSIKTVLRSAMATRWDRAYRKNEVLVDDFSPARQVGWHSLIRTKPFRKRVIKRKRRVRKIDPVKGRLLLVETPEMVKLRSYRIRRTGRIVMASGSISLLLGCIPIFLDISFTYPWSICIASMLTAGLVLLIVGGVFLKTMSIYKPVRFYEKGIHYFYPGVGRGEFVMYSEMDEPEEHEMFGQRLIRFYKDNGIMVIDVLVRTPGLHELMPYINTRIEGD